MTKTNVEQILKARIEVLYLQTCGHLYILNPQVEKGKPMYYNDKRQVRACDSALEWYCPLLLRWIQCWARFTGAVKMERPMSMMQWWKNIRCPSLSWEDHSVVIILGQTQSSKSRVAICNNCLIEGKIRLSNLGEAQDPPKLVLASPCARKALRWQGIWHAHRCWLLLSWEGAELLKILEWDSARRHGPAKYCTCPKSGHNCSAQFARLRVFFFTLCFSLSFFFGGLPSPACAGEGLGQSGTGPCSMMWYPWLSSCPVSDSSLLPTCEWFPAGHAHVCRTFGQASS